MTDPADAWHAAAIFAVDPPRIGGVVVRARIGPTRDRWRRYTERLLSVPPRPLPIHVTDDRLLGGLDLAATLQTGRVVAERGLLASAHGGVLQAPMAERLAVGTTAHLGRALDEGRIIVERNGIARSEPARFGLIAFDEGIDDERVSPKLADRLAIHLDLESCRLGTPPAPPTLDEARERLATIEAPGTVIEALCTTALVLGIGSLRAPWLGLEVARIAAALAGRAVIAEDDVTLAARLVLAPRATRLPAPPEEEDACPDPPESEHDGNTPEEAEAGPLDDVMLEAARSALPEGLLERLAANAGPNAARAHGPAGAEKKSKLRGRAVGTHRGRWSSGARLNVVETLRAAAPWQKIRRRSGRASGRGEGRIEVRADDLRIKRFISRTETTTIFAVDASGSAAFQRLAEAKGAVEQVLADCYIRRDHVALVGFRGTQARLLLPPTRSLVRAKRSLAELPGGGTTPLASGIEAAVALARDARAKGHAPAIVLMTDGRANIARDGQPGRARAAEDALAAARLVRATGIPALFIDTAPRPQPTARRLAGEMAALYLPLPQADAAGISKLVRSMPKGS